MPWPKGKPRPAETRKRIGDANRGQKRPQISAALKGRPKPEGFGTHISEFMRGRRHGTGKRSTETCARISLALQGNQRGLGNHNAGAKKGVKKSPEHAAKLRAHLANLPKRETDIERKIQNLLLCQNVHFQPQEWLAGIRRVDFFVPPDLIIECDGCYWHGHLECTTPRGPGVRYEVADKDARLDAMLLAAGYRTLRLWECEIHNEIGACWSRISDAMAERQ